MPDRTDAYDRENHMWFCGPKRVSKILNTLAGLLDGVQADGRVDEAEARALRQWCDENRELSNREPFGGIHTRLSELLDGDDEPDVEDVRDVLWICQRAAGQSSQWNQATCDMQVLEGLLYGIAADGQLTTEELTSLQEWLTDHEQLAGVWPYTEVNTLLTDTLADGKIDKEEHLRLLGFFSEFVRLGTHAAISEPPNEFNTPLGGLCAVCPEIHVEGHTFCFTGRSERSSRAALKKLVEVHKGFFKSGMSQQVDYLIIGADGSEAWAFNCYGRKVEEAISLRKDGHDVLLVHEFDFWDTIDDL